MAGRLRSSRGAGNSSILAQSRDTKTDRSEHRVLLSIEHDTLRFLCLLFQRYHDSTLSSPQEASTDTQDGASEDVEAEDTTSTGRP